jgi:hypothetical protein
MVMDDVSGYYIMIFHALREMVMRNVSLPSALVLICTRSGCGREAMVVIGRIQHSIPSCRINANIVYQFSSTARLNDDGHLGAHLISEGMKCPCGSVVDTARRDEMPFIRHSDYSPTQRFP